MKEEIDADQFDRWRTFFARAPFDPESMFWIPAATVSMHVLNSFGGRTSNPVRVRDLLPTRAAAKPVSVDEKLKARFAQLIEQQANKSPA